jgi:hypothetical protein
VREGPDVPKKKSRRPSPRLTHFEVRRGDTLRLRVTIADEAMGVAGDEVGALVRRVAPCVATRTVAPAADPEEFVVTPQHPPDDDVYHARLRERLVDLFSSLCDASLADALEIAREERARRAEGGN